MNSKSPARRDGGPPFPAGAAVPISLLLRRAICDILRAETLRTP